MSNDSFRDEEDTVDVENESNSEADIPNLPAVSFGGKRLRSKDDKLSAILAKRSKERNEMLSNIQAQNNLLASQNPQQEDEVDVFFKSIAMTVKKLPSRAINEAKLRVLTMVNEMEEKYVVPDHTKTIRPDYILPLNINNMTQWLSPANSYNTAASSSSSGFIQYNHDSNSMTQCPSPVNSSNTAASSSSCGFVQYNNDSNSMTQCPSPANSSNTAASISSCGFVPLNHNENK